MLKRSHLVAAFAVLLVAVGAPGAHAATGALPVGEDGEFTLAPLVREVAPAVVNIAGTGPRSGDNALPARSSNRSNAFSRLRIPACRRRSARASSSMPRTATS